MGAAVKVRDLTNKTQYLDGNDEIYLFDGSFREIESIDFYQNFDEPGKVIMMIASGERKSSYEMAGGQLCQSTELY